MGTQRYSSWVIERTQIGECHRLRVGMNSVGRHSSSLIRILDSHYVSRHHAEIEVSPDDQAVTIKDLVCPYPPRHRENITYGHHCGLTFPDHT